MVFIRCIFGCLSLGAWYFLTGHARDLIDSTSAACYWGILSDLFLGLNWMAIEAFRLTSIGFATIIDHLQPFWILLAGGLLLGETISRAKYF